MVRTLWSRVNVSQLDLALPPSMPRPWLMASGSGPSCTQAEWDGDPQDAYEVACMELAAFLAWLISQARARSAAEVFADLRHRPGLLAEVASSWTRLPDDTKIDWIPSDHCSFLADVLGVPKSVKVPMVPFRHSKEEGFENVPSWVPQRRLRRKTCATPGAHRLAKALAEEPDTGGRGIHSNGVC
ncbi:unnamed protein product [Symbiodinium natans]|uniref:Uncharacterized protein n=1 Tax=Symbiodinium natans TaxID=878477 RepID=A0A812JH45_9DINO|nr:unnamed protein product [Symbiodinium natans]